MNAKSPNQEATAKAAITIRKYFCSKCGIPHSEDRGHFFFQHRIFAENGMIYNIDPITRKEVYATPTTDQLHQIIGTQSDSCSCGAEVVACQICGHIVCVTTSRWMTPVPEKEFAGNVCFSCIFKMPKVRYLFALSGLEVKEIKSLESSSREHYLGFDMLATHVVMTPKSQICYAVCRSLESAEEAKKNLLNVSVR